jgi:deazaflavin-dependent oxidoreductase (nitroreductase family)
MLSTTFTYLSRLLSRKSMRPVTRLFTNLHVLLYKLTGGKAQIAKYPTMLLTVKGRKTGKLRTVPLIYIRDADRFVIAAAYAGSEQNPTWWLNLQASGEGLVQVMRDAVRVRAQVAPPEARAELWQRLSAMYPYFTDYQTRTSREIPIVILSPMEKAAV